MFLQGMSKVGVVLGKLGILLPLSPMLVGAEVVAESAPPVPPLQITQALDPRKVEADRLFNQGREHYRKNRAYSEMSQLGAAIRSWQQALELYREIKDRQGEGNALFSLGTAYSAYFSRGDAAKVIEYQEQSLAIFREIKDRQGEGNALFSLGRAYRTLGNAAKVIEYQEQSLAIFREIKDREREGNALLDLERAYNELGNYAKEIEYRKQRLAIAREIKDRQGETNPIREGNALLRLGNTDRNLSNRSEAIEYLEQRLAIAREIKDRRGEQEALSSLGSAYQALGNATKAIEYYEQSLAIARDINNRHLEWLVLGNLVNTYRDLRNYPKAIEYQQQRLATSREIQDPTPVFNQRREGMMLRDLGNTYAAFGNYSKAIEYQEQSLAIFRKTHDRQEVGNTLSSLGNAYRALGNYSKAIDYYEQRLAIAQDIKDRQLEWQVLGDLGNTYAAFGNYPKAIEYHEQRLAIARDIKNRRREGEALENLGNTHSVFGNYPKAEQTLLEAISIYESMRENLEDTDKVLVADRYRFPYNTLQQVLIAQKKIEPALEIAERGRARAFAELLVQRTRGTDIPIVKPLQIEVIKQAARQQQATLVEYTQISREQLLIWVVQPTGEVAFRSVDLKPLRQQRTSLDNLIHAARCLGESSCEAAIASRGSSRINFNLAQSESQVVELPVATRNNQYLQRLHQLLIDPIADLLPKTSNERVIFIPQGQMFLMPFAALQDEQGRYLIEKHQILLSPSIQVLQLIHQQRQAIPAKAGEVVLVGNPTMPAVSQQPGEPAKQLSSLVGAEVEARAISDLLKVPALIGQQATETKVKALMPKARIIHLATHGLLDDLGGKGLPGAIALAPDPQNDGLLTANELLKMNLKAELVVLSACDTGRGRITGDGVIGLSRALMTAGVPSVVVSLWKVPDAPTSTLMSQFYRHLSQGKDKAAALRQAMLDTQKVFPDPVNWAAFVLMGEAK